jgi:hypothetical protein
MKQLLGAVFSAWSMPRIFKRTIYHYSRVMAGSNTSTLRIVGGDKKENLESETVKYGVESHVTRADEGQQQL